MRLLKEFGAYLWDGKKFWLLPIIAALLIVGALVVVSEMSPLSPFIYPFF